MFDVSITDIGLNQTGRNVTQLSSSPERGSFGIEGLLRRAREKGLDPDTDPHVLEMTQYYQNAMLMTRLREQREDFKEQNLEYDLRSTDWILEKVRGNDVYAQNLYAALCNNDFVSTELFPYLKGQRWHCSWRYAGGIIADMQERGDYVDWYCSGIQQDYDGDLKRDYVSESIVTDEIREDLLRLGWAVVDPE
jgi:hypothetical protein